MTSGSRVHVVGTGLIGTSVGLALRAQGHHVTLEDPHAPALELAVALGAGVAGPQDVEDAWMQPDLAVVTVPPDAVANTLLALQRRDLKCTVMDVASVKTKPLLEAEQLGVDMSVVVGSHPMAGRERSGPGAARDDLFQGRAWVLCPTGATSAQSLEVARQLVHSCGAVPIAMSPDEHDRAVALVSHLPQIVASLTAKQLLDAPEAFLRLAGQGLRDTTRVAASDPELWVQILGANATALQELLGPLRDDLAELSRAVDDVAMSRPPDSSTGRLSDKSTGHGRISAALQAGRTGRSRLPGKHGAAHTTYATVPVVIHDRPGELARLLMAAGDAGVNVEDLAIEHSPGQPVGLVELAVAPGSVELLASSLRALGWDVHVEESRPSD